VNFVTGPATPPLGVGSAELKTGDGSTGGDCSAELRNGAYSGVKLSTITALSYWTYDVVNNGQQFPYLELNVSTTGGATPDDALFFEPPYQQPGNGGSDCASQGEPALSTWQKWDAAGGCWWSNGGTLNPGTGSGTLADYLATYPNATIVNSSTGGAVHLVVGFASSTDRFDGNVDAVTIGVSGSNTTYDFEPAKPSAPINPTAVPGNGSVAVSWTPPSGTVTSYNVTASPGGRTCSTNGVTTHCTVTGLTNGTPYRFTVTATNAAGTGPGATTATVVPATTGFHVYASPPVVEQGTPVTISETGAMVHSTVSLTVVGRGTHNVTTDAYGAGYTTFTIPNFGKFKIKAQQGASQATGTLYVAIVYTPSSVQHGHQINVGVNSAIPGSTLHVTTNRGGNYYVPVPATGHVVVHIPGTYAGNLRITVTDNGWRLVVRNVPIT
jgi:hypothetical protein